MASSALVGALRASLSLDTAAFEDGSKKAVGAADRLAKNISRTLKAIGVGAIIKEMFDAFKSVIDKADQFQELAQKIGIPVEQLSALELAAKTSGTSLETLATSIGRLSRNIGGALANPASDAARAFQALGISTRELQSLSPSELIARLADRFREIPDGSRQAALGMSLFGRNFLEIVPLLNQGSAELDRFRKIADQVGLTIDARTAAAADRFNDNLTIMNGVMQGVTTQIITALLPSLDRYIQKLTDTSTGSSTVQRFTQFVIESLKSLVHMLDTAEMRFANVVTSFIAMRRIMQEPFGFGFFDRVSAIWAQRTKEIEANFSRIRAAYSELNNSINARGGVGGRGGGIGGTTTAGAAGGVGEEPPIIAVPKKAKFAWEGLSRSIELTADQLGKLPPLSQELSFVWEDLGGNIGEALFDAAKGTQSLTDSFRQMVDDMLREIIRLFANRAFLMFLSALGGMGAYKPGVGPGGMGFTHFGGPRQHGGRVSRGKSFLVGERGPEFFTPRTAGSIVPHGALGNQVNVQVIDQRSMASPAIERQQSGDGSQRFIVRDAVRSVLPGELNRLMPAQFGVVSRLKQKGS